MSDSDSDVALSKRFTKYSLNTSSNSIKKEAFDSDSSDEPLIRKRKTLKDNKVNNSTNNKRTRKTTNSDKERSVIVSSRQKKKQIVKHNKNDDSDTDEISNDIKRQFREGQKFITPPNGDATRAFYESLYEENPYSIIALKYCVENGVLMGAKHMIAYERLEFLRESGYLKRSLGGIQKEAVECLKSFDCKRGGFQKVRSS